MEGAGQARSADTPATVGLGNGVHSPSQRSAAVAICAVLVAVTLLGARFGTVQGPDIKPFLPIVATIWALADMMTAFLLLAQFYVNGATFFTALAAAYALSGLLTIPYLIAFPGLFRTGPIPLAEQQISIWIWSLWHVTFPAIVAVCMARDPQLEERIFSRAATNGAIRMTVLATFCASGVLAALTIGDSAALPKLLVDGHFLPLFSRVVAPAIVLFDIVGCTLLARRRSALTTLELWLFVAMFAAALDALLNSTSPSRYSYGWYAGKIETVVTASVVLGILLREVTSLYKRLAEMATVDALTRLPNRRALDDRMRLVFGDTKRRASEFGLIVVDVDFFKGYNDSYGHAQGDECLRRIAALLKSAARRPLDLAARYGGEEFVILLPDTPRTGAVAVAKRILALFETVTIPYAGYARGHVTVSAGVAHVANARDVDAERLFEMADRALYEAKRRGRRAFVVVDGDATAADASEAPSGDAGRLVSR